MTAQKPLLLTGAAGVLGRWLRPRLIDCHGTLLSSDIADPGEIQPNERFIHCDLADRAAVDALVAQASAILHFGGVSTEHPFDTILPANIVGTYNVFEAARRHNVRRIVYASSNHVIGFHPAGHRLDADSPTRPDGYYGVSKAFGENLASLYVDKHGFDVACLRIGSCIPTPNDPRHLSTWLSYDDLLALIEACLAAPKLGFTILYGASANARTWWDNGKAGHIAYQPHDNAETLAAEILKDGDRRDPNDPATRFQGGPFCAIDYGT